MRLSSADLPDERYAIERELGRGGMASVWLARDVRHDRLVAIKVLHPELAAAIGVDRFLREIRITARLQHSNVVPVFDSGVFPGPGGVTLAWYTMPYLPGESLRAHLDRHGQLSLEDALRIAEEAAAALQAAHDEGIVHRDIKPENLLLSGGGTWIVDFGIARAVAESAGDRLTSAGLAIGTPAYMSPEQAAAERVDARTDQYSLASVLYEMLVGEPPFTGPTAQAIVARRMAGPPRSMRPIRPSVPQEVESAVLRALERVPADRFPSVSAFAAALRSGSTPPHRSPPRRAGLGRFAAAAALAALVVFGGWLVMQRRRAGDFASDPRAAALRERGLQAFSRRTPAGSREAIAAYSAAIRLDSADALAWAGLAEAHVQAYGRRFVFPGDVRDSAIRIAVAAADRALLLEPRSADAWVARGFVSRQVDPTDMAPAVAAFRRAIALDSSHARAWRALGVTLVDVGDLTAGLDAARRAVALDPSYAEALAFLALDHYWRRQYDSAARWADSAVATDPTYLLGRSTLGNVAVERGDHARARAAFDAGRRVATEVELLNTTAGAALVEARRGRRAEAEQLLREAESLAADYVPIPLHSAVYLAQAHAALGERDAAIEWVSRVVPRDDLHFQLHLRCDPPFDPIANEPRFRSMLRGPRPAAGLGC